MPRTTRNRPSRHGLLAPWACFALSLTVSATEARGQTSLHNSDMASTTATQLAQPIELLPPVEADRGLTLELLEQMALGSNPSVGRAAALVQAARGAALQAGLGPNPSVGYEGQQLGSGGVAEQHGVLFSQEVVRGGKLQLSRAVADRERMRLEQELAAQELKVLTDVRIAYYQVLLAERQIELAEELGRISEEGSTTVDKLFGANEVGKADVLQAQLEVENARILVTNARNRYESSWRSLTAVAGNPTLAPQHLEGDAEAPTRDFNYEDTLSRVLSLSPELASKSLEVERARVAVQRARVEPVSNVSFQGLVNWQDNGIGGKPDGGLAVSIPLPIFNRNQGGIARAEHELIAARQGLSTAELNVQSRLAQVFEQLQNARNQVNRYRTTILPAAQESLDLTRRVYTSGETNYTALLTAQRTYSQTNLNYFDALRQLRIAEVQIDGLLLSGSLSSGPSDSSVPQAAPIDGSVPAGGVELFR